MRLNDTISITKKDFEGRKCRCCVRTGLQFGTIPDSIEIRFKQTIARWIPLVCSFRLVKSDLNLDNNFEIFLGLS